MDCLCATLQPITQLHLYSNCYNEIPELHVIPVALALMQTL